MVVLPSGGPSPEGSPPEAARARLGGRSGLSRRAASPGQTGVDQLSYVRGLGHPSCARRRRIGAVIHGTRYQPTETAATETTSDTIARDSGGRGFVNAT